MAGLLLGARLLLAAVFFIAALAKALNRAASRQALWFLCALAPALGIPAPEQEHAHVVQMLTRIFDVAAASSPQRAAA